MTRAHPQTSFAFALLCASVLVLAVVRTAKSPQTVMLRNSPSKVKVVVWPFFQQIQLRKKKLVSWHGINTYVVLTHLARE